MTAPLLSLSALTKTYPETGLVLGGIDLSISPGETLSLVGPSGCGKSTCLRLIAGLEQPDSGVVTWPSLNGGLPKPGDIGYVFQDPTLMPWATVLDNVLLPLKLYATVAEQNISAAHQLIAKVGLKGFENSLPRALSGGMRMRVSLARALITQPKILLLDEPFAALDEITRNGLNDLLVSLKAQTGVTIIFVTHSVLESVFLSDRIVVMKSQPGVLFSETRIDPPPEGRTEAYRFHPTYADQCASISDALSRATSASGQTT